MKIPPCAAKGIFYNMRRRLTRGRGIVQGNCGIAITKTWTRKAAINP